MISTKKFTKNDLGWLVIMFATSIGAGILYLPIQASKGGIWTLVVITTVLFPIIYHGHRNFSRVVMSHDKPMDFEKAVEEHLGKWPGIILTAIYFIVIFSILSVYITGLTNDSSELLYLSHITKGQLSHIPLFSLSLLAILGGIVLAGEKLILKITSILVYPLMAILFITSIALIPHWNLSMFTHFPSLHDFIKSLLMTFPIIIFALHYSPIISTCVRSYRQKDEKTAPEKIDMLLKINTILTMFFVMFFVFSCVLTLNKAEVAMGLHDNLSIMSVFAAFSSNKFLIFLGPTVGVISITAAFFGSFLGAKECMRGMIRKFIYMCITKKKISEKVLDKIAFVVLILILWFIAVMNFRIVDIMGEFAGPFLATILFLMPVYTIFKVKELKPLRTKTNMFIFGVGILLVISYIVGIFL